MGNMCGGVKASKGIHKNDFTGFHGEWQIRIGLEAEVKWLTLASFSACFNKMLTFPEKTEVIIVDFPNLQLNNPKLALHVSEATLDKQFSDPKTSSVLFSFKHLVIFCQQELLRPFQASDTIDLTKKERSPLLDFLQFMFFQCRIHLLSFSVCVEPASKIQKDILTGKSSERLKILFNSQDYDIRTLTNKGNYPFVIIFGGKRAIVSEKPGVSIKEPDGFTVLRLDDKQFKSSVKGLLKNGGKAVLTWQNSEEKQFALQKLADASSKIFKVESESVFDYFREIHVIEPKKNQQENARIEPEKEKKGKKLKKRGSNLENGLGIESKRVEEMKNIMKEIKKNELAAYVEITRSLMANIIREPSEEKFRKIRSTNKKLQPMINGKFNKILAIIGFYPKEENGENVYVNSLSGKEMKLLETDFNLAFSKLT